ncbi:MAG: hypothetical protein ACEPOW_14065 [Bacteroidales bacterium]
MITYHIMPAISLDWGERIQLKNSDKVNVIIGENVYPLYTIDLRINIPEKDGVIEIEIATEVESSIYRLLIGPEFEQGYKYILAEGSEVYIQTNKSEQTILNEYMVFDPLIINYSDGSFSYNNYLIKPKLDQDLFDNEKIETWDWTGIPLNCESMGKEINPNTIQFRTYVNIKDKYDIIINDDGTGESCDLLCLKDEEENNIKLTLIHCKNAINKRSGADIRDLYTVCGQAQKSVKIKHRGLNKLLKEIRSREEKWVKDNYTRFLKGKMKDFIYLKNKSRTSNIIFEIIIVQPGISKSKISNDMLRLLGTTELLIKKTSQGNFRVIGSI